MTGPKRELILYATPTGPLAAAVDRYFTVVGTELTPTTAQTYPPHCTLTGFFRRHDGGVQVIVDEVGQVIAEAGPVPPGAVEVSLRTSDDWVGLELHSPWLRSLTDQIVARHRPGPADDALRRKEWLHLSLAYGIVELGPHARLAEATVDPQLDAGWEVGLWERHPDATWSRHPCTGAGTDAGDGTGDGRRLGGRRT